MHCAFIVDTLRKSAQEHTKAFRDALLLRAAVSVKGGSSSSTSTSNCSSANFRATHVPTCTKHELVDDGQDSARGGGDGGGTGAFKPANSEHHNSSYFMSGVGSGIAVCSMCSPHD